MQTWAVTVTVDETVWRRGGSIIILKADGWLTVLLSGGRYCAPRRATAYQIHKLRLWAF